MFNTYLKTAWRHLIKDKTPSFINIGGLAIGIAVVLLISLWIRDELNFDKYNQHYPTIGQIARKEISKSDTYISDNNNHFPVPLAEELRRNYGNLFRKVSLVSEKSSHTLLIDDRIHTTTGIFAEKDFTDIFTLKLTGGSVSGFSEPNSILLGQSTAESLFGKADPIGKTVKFDNEQPLTVIGVYQDVPLNTSLSGTGFICPFSFLVNTNPGVKGLLADWNNSSFFLYADAQPGISEKDIQGAIKEVYWSKIKNSAEASAGTKVELFLHPMRDWHLRSEWKNGVQSGGQIRIVELFGMIGAFVLILACINFMNLSTARSGKRAKEVGVRKTMGSGRNQLIKQFMGEALLMVAIAFLLGTGIVILSLHGFNEMARKNIAFPFFSIGFWLSATVFIFLTTLLSGSYPALYLSSFKPLPILKGGFKAGRSAGVLRKFLLTTQFVASIVIIIGTIVVYRQIQLAKDRPIGYDRNGLIRITMTTSDLKGKYDVLQNELLSSGGAVAIAQSSSAATENNYFDDRFEWEGKNPQAARQAFTLTAVTPEYGKTVGWQFVEGRDFSKNLASDKNAIILNEASVKYMALTHPVGKNIRWNGNLFTVVGVIKDMVKESPYKPVQQGIFFMIPDIGPEITIRLNPQLSAAVAIGKIEPVFKRLNPSAEFNYTFVDDEYAYKFAAERRVGALSNVFSVLAVIISCLGIFGLASFVAEQRAKEIGMRKVLGASVLNIWQLLTKDFVVIVILATVIATPIAWYFAHSWLEGYEYRATLSAWIFLSAGSGVLFITLATASIHVVKAALANPIDRLKAE